MILVFLAPSLVVVLEYSHDRMVKKRAPVISVLCAVARGDEVSFSTACQTVSGRQAWWLVAGSLSV